MTSNALAMNLGTLPWRRAVVLGLGASGFSSAQYLIERQVDLQVLDTRDNPPFRDNLENAFPDVPVHCGIYDDAHLNGVDVIVVSPGVSLSDSFLKKARSRKIEILGDIELFARVCPAPVIAITGSNGKTTVTTIVSEMLRAQGLDVRVGGNIGRPALDLIDDHIPDVFVLELSSFQLETTSSLRPRSAAILNLSADHMDRYADFGSYANAKKRILTNAETAVINVDDSNLAQLNIDDGVQKISFSLSCPTSDQEYGIRSDGSHEWIMRGSQKIVRTDLLSMNGRHNILNALAAIGLVESSGYPVSDRMIKALTEFRGLPHRCEQVLSKDDITWINDSKGTNPGATIAALRGMGRPVVLISGGQSKGADFTQFADAVQRYTRQVLLVGEDRLWIAEAIGSRVPVTLADDLNHAIRLASRWAQSGDAVLFSPACASFDMFKNFEHRGDVFRQLVQELIT